MDVERCYCGGYTSSDPYWSQVDTVEAFSPGLYLVVDNQGRIVRLGRPAGDHGGAGRIRTHQPSPVLIHIADGDGAVSTASGHEVSGGAARQRQVIQFAELGDWLTEGLGDPSPGG
ncbi:MAG: hypothetical protein ACRDOV_01585 [Streptomyces sp.]